MDELEHSQWSGRTDGQPWMQRSLVWMMRTMPLWILYSIMAVVIIFYMIFRRKGYLSIYHFARKQLDYNPAKAFFHVYANHFRFGQVILDRFCAYAGKPFEFDIEGRDTYMQMATKREGMIQVSAHIGNYEMAGYGLKIPDKLIYAVIYGGETATVSEHRHRLFREHNIEPLIVRADMSHLFTMNAALEHGDVVSMPSDRLFGSPKYLCCQILGCEAHIPMGAFVLAEKKKVKMLSIFVMKSGYKRYSIYVAPLESDPTLPSQQRMQQLAQQYCDRISDMIRRYPTQWFNYYEYFDYSTPQTAS